MNWVSSAAWFHLKWILFQQQHHVTRTRSFFIFLINIHLTSKKTIHKIYKVYMIYILQSIGLPVDSLYDIPILLVDGQAISLIAKILLLLCITKSSYSVLGTGYQSSKHIWNVFPKGTRDDGSSQSCCRAYSENVGRLCSSQFFFSDVNETIVDIYCYTTNLTHGYLTSATFGILLFSQCSFLRGRRLQ